MTRTATPSGAIVSTVVLEGNPARPGETFVIGVRLDGNTTGPVGTYAFTVLWPAETVGYVSVGMGDYSELPTVNPSAGRIDLSAFDPLSQLYNGALFTIVLQTTAAPGLPYDIRLEPLGSNSLLAMRSTLEAVPIGYWIDTGATSGIGGP